jgi:hypothetical protein
VFATSHLRSPSVSLAGFRGVTVDNSSHFIAGPAPQIPIRTQQWLRTAYIHIIQQFMPLAFLSTERESLPVDSEKVAQ